MSENVEAQDQAIDQLVDTDPEETAEWHASFDSALAHAGPVRARYLMLSLLNRAQERNVGIPNLRTTDYINTIPPEREPEFPGDEAIERRIRGFHPLECRDVGAPGPTSGRRRRWAYFNLCFICRVIRSGFQSFLPWERPPTWRRSNLLPRSRQPGHVCTCIYGGPFHRTSVRWIPPRTFPSRRGTFLISASAPNARVLGISNCIDGHWTPQCHLSSEIQSISA